MCYCEKFGYEIQINVRFKYDFALIFCLDMKTHDSNCMSREWHFSRVVTASWNDSHLLMKTSHRREHGFRSFLDLKTSNMMWTKQQPEALLVMCFKLPKSLHISCVISFKGETSLCRIRQLLFVGITILIKVTKCNCYYYVPCSMCIMLYCFQ